MSGRNIITSNKQVYTLLSYPKDNIPDRIKNNMERYKYVRRTDLEFGSASNLAIYVSDLYNKHHVAKFAETIKTVSIIPMCEVDGTFMIIVKKYAFVKPITINYDDSFTIEKAVLQRTKEEFVIGTESFIPLDIKTKNTTIPNPLTNVDEINREWVFVIAKYKKAPDNSDLLTIEDYVNQLNKKIRPENYCLLEEINKKLYH